MHPYINVTDLKPNDYLIVLIPNKDLWDKMMIVKEAFAREFKTTQARSIKPQIALVRFSHLSQQENKIINRLKAIATTLAPIKIEIKNFGSLPSHSILFNITSKLPIESVINELRTASPIFKYNNEHKPHFLEEPQILLCNKLKPWQYEQAWLKYSHLHFTGRFIAEGMQLLKRNAGEKSFCLLKQFQFNEQPVKTEQGNLFI